MATPLSCWALDLSAWPCRAGCRRHRRRIGLASTEVVVDGPPLPTVHAKAWLVADADTGEVLAAYRAHRQLRPASTLKTLTADHLAAAARPARGLPRAVRRRRGRRQSGRLGTGCHVHRRTALLRHVPAERERRGPRAGARRPAACTEDVDADAAPRHKHLQADDTHVVNPYGLDAPGQVTSAYDLALFARAGLTRSDFRHYCSTVTYAFPGRPAQEAAQAARDVPDLQPEPDAGRRLRGRDRRQDRVHDAGRAHLRRRGRARRPHARGHADGHPGLQRRGRRDTADLGVSPAREADAGGARSSTR